MSIDEVCMYITLEYSTVNLFLTARILNIEYRIIRNVTNSVSYHCLLCMRYAHKTSLWYTQQDKDKDDFEELMCFWFVEEMI